MVFEGAGMIKFIISMTFFMEIQESFVFLREMEVLCTPGRHLGTSKRDQKAKTSIFL